MTTTRRGRLLKDLEPGEPVMALDLWRDETGTEPPGARDDGAAGYLKGATSAQVCRLAEYVGARAVLAPARMSGQQLVAAYRDGKVTVGPPPPFRGFADVLARRTMYALPAEGGQVRAAWPVVAFDLDLLAFVLGRTVSEPGKYLVSLPGTLKDYPALWPRGEVRAGQ